jgi:cation diffusion facilitator family transporter
MMLEPGARHDHIFLGESHDRHARRTWFVVCLTLAMMVAEIAGGTVFGSMALIADGWHMSTHALALGIAALAYRFARRHQHDPRFSFGTGKMGELAAFTSAIVLMLIAVYILAESVARLRAPVAIHFNEATWIALLGLIVNLVSAALLFNSEAHGHDHGHTHDDDHDHARGHDDGSDHHLLKGDTNIQAAFVHVLADALTSVLAIAALLGGRFFGWIWLDPVIGIVGAVVIISWGVGLLRTAGSVLLDMVPSRELSQRIKARLEQDGDRITDFHLWQLGPKHAALIASIMSDDRRDAAYYRARLDGIAGLSHVTIEVQRRAAPSHAPVEKAHA